MKSYKIFYPKAFCKFYPFGYVSCVNGQHLCGSCEVANKFRAIVSEKTSFELFGPNDALPLTKKGCTNFTDKLLILRPEAMKRLELPENVLFQFVVAMPSPGCFEHNPVGFIDCILFADRNRTFTVYRNEVFGVPSDLTMALYNSYFNKAIDNCCVFT